MAARSSRLLALMESCSLAPRDVARLVGVSPKTVYNWRSPGSDDVIPRYRLDLLETRLKLDGHTLPDEEARA